MDEPFLHEFSSLIIDAFKGTDTVNPISMITDQLYLGQGRTTLYGAILHRFGITHIISVGREPHGSVSTQELSNI